MNDETTYICGACGEEIVVPIDITQGNEQEYVEDCPVCCRANLIRIEIDVDGETTAWAEMKRHAPVPCSHAGRSSALSDDFAAFSEAFRLPPPSPAAKTVGA